MAHVFATQTLLQRRAQTLAINISGTLRAGVTAKDLILAIISRIGVAGGTGRVLEYRGSAIDALGMDERMTICNMSIEAGARAGMIAPDDITYAYLESRARAPKGTAWQEAVQYWRTLPSDAGARYDSEVSLDGSAVEPMITYGTNPGMAVPITGSIPERSADPVFAHALAYMGLKAGQPIADQPIDVVFIGSCTNGRLSDLRGRSPAARRPQDRPRRAGAGRSRFAADQAGRGSRRPGSHIPRCRRRMARIRLLDVHRDERRYR